MNMSIKLGAAFIGLMAGSGFASGQEILQFFTLFGEKGFLAIALATLLFAFFVTHLYQLGSKLQAHSHKEVINFLGGPYLGKAMDLMLSFFLFAVVVVILAGANSSLQQQLHTNSYLGGALLALATLLTVCLGLQQIMTVMSLVTPMLLIMVLMLSGYALSTTPLPLHEFINFSHHPPKAVPSWWLSAALYVSYNLAATSAVLVVMGSRSKQLRQAAWGGIWGGMGIGILLFLMNIAMLVKFDEVKDQAIPTLYLSKQIGKWTGHAMLIFLIIKMYATVVGITYTFAIRCTALGLTFKKAALLTLVMAYGASFVGFVELVEQVYPIMGYLGFVLMATIAWRWAQTIYFDKPKEHPTSSLL
jgi:uncharacterized membrane protein YkvI